LICDAVQISFVKLQRKPAIYSQRVTTLTYGESESLWHVEGADTCKALPGARSDIDERAFNGTEVQQQLVCRSTFGAGPAEHVF